MGEILVVYASRAGSSREVAEAIGAELGDADVKRAREVKDLRPYRAVVAGGCIHMGAYLPELSNWLEGHKTELQALPVAYFAVCMLLKDDTGENRAAAVKWLEPLNEIARPVSTGLFAGKIEYRKLPFFERVIVTKMVKAPEFDARDWEAIRSWAHELRPLFAVRELLV
ncbi:MAG: flavodoxin domain-containing protein [Anaerolineae bacterium]